MSPTTYRDAGVDIEAGNELARRLARLTRGTYRREVVSGIGGFSGISALPDGIDDPLLVSSTDGVGTKLKIAFATNNHHTVGIDLVAMGVNDILTVGAEPLFFLDYFATGKLDLELTEAVIAGVVEGCRQAGCALLGGETAEMPEMYAPGEYDLAGFVVGVVERAKLIDGRRTRPGDLVVGLPSSGLHSNGFSLARKVLLGDDGDRGHGHAAAEVIPELGRSMPEELLEPTKIYAVAVRTLLESVEVHALAHITGGGLVDNPPRSVPDDAAFVFDTRRWDLPPVMEMIARRGEVPLEEMRRTFNMGLGMVAVVPADQADIAVRVLAEHGGVVVGEIIPRAEPDRSVEFIP